MDGTPFGRYRLIELLGRGGMGEVWRARDTATNNRIVAIKLLPPHLATDSTFVERFRREADAAAQLNNPHIIPIHNYGEIDGRLYVDMRLVEGRNLQEVLADGPIEPGRAVRIIEQVAKALNAAHKIGLVHRDVKPSNILLDDDDFAYLIDFGIARGADHTGLTNTGATIGTWHYMAPERFSAREADARADIYALACVLYECLTGSRPFPGNTLESQVAAHLTDPPPQPSTMQPKVPAALDAVIATGMAKQPENRYPSTVQLAAAARDAITTPTAKPPPQPAPPYPPSSPEIATIAARPTPDPTPAPQWDYAYPPTPPPTPPLPPLPPPYNAPFPSTPQSTTAGHGGWIVFALAAAVVVAIVAGLIGVVYLFASGSSDVGSATGRSSVSPSGGSITTTPHTSMTIPNTSTAPATPVVPKGPAQLHTADGLSGLITTIRDRFGDTMGYRLVIYPDYAVLDRASPTNAHVTQSFMYRDGNWKSWAPDSSKSPLDLLADLGQFNAAAVIAQLASPPPSLDITDTTKSYLIAQGAEGGGIELQIHNNAPGTGFMMINPDGSIKQLYPPS